NASQEIYHHGSKLKLPPQSQDAPQLVLTDHSWLLEPSAANFATIVRDMESAGIDTRDNQYVLHYRERSPEAVDDGRRLLEATLVLNRVSLHAVEEVLVIAEGGEKLELRFTESSFERLPSSDVDQKVFEPDAQLLAPLVEAVPENAPVAVANLKAPSGLTAPPNPAELTTLEVDVLYLLDQVNANAGEQVEIRRLASGELLVQALVETDARKVEILKALSPVASNPRVTTEVLTVEEALRRERVRSKTPTSLDRIVITANRIPVYEEVRQYLERERRARAATDKNALVSPSEIDSDIDEDIQRLSSRVIDQSRQGLHHAFALKRLVGRFSARDLNSLTDDSRRKWHEMIRTHARAFRESTGLLRRDLVPIFGESQRGQSMRRDESASMIPSMILRDADLVETVDQLVKLALANDEAISHAFALHPDTTFSVLGSAVFWSNFNRAENLAAALERIESRGSQPRP
ncbi:MAG TPA: hypothetical protein VJ180_11835, partial [Pyrinomonadaceae bacterium]|nr:hypothetical protein [Pyrinomonadaceae bacterium]